MVGCLLFIFIVWAMVVLCGLGAILLVPLVFYLLTLQKALSRCSVESRALDPGLVWLTLIPVFNLVWQFFIVTNVATSLHNEFVRRGIVAEPHPGQGIGLAMCILLVCALNPLLFVPCGIAWLICWIVYWATIAGYSAKLAFPYTPPNPPPVV